MYTTKKQAEKAGWTIRQSGNGNWIAKKGSNAHVARTIKDLLYKIGGVKGSCQY